MAEEAVARFAGFLAALWAAGRLCSAARAPPMLGELLVGVALGPHGAAFAPTAVAQLLGQVGVLLLLFEAGMDMDLECLVTLGARAAAVAVLGMAVPIGLAVLLLLGAGVEPMPGGLAAGCALAPTSVAVAALLLAEAKLTRSRLGQTIVASAALDDVLSLVLLLALVSLGDEEAEGLDVLYVLLFGLLFLGVGVGVVGMALAPRVPMHRASDEVLVAAMVASLAAAGAVGALLGSPLLGAFVAGTWFTGRRRARAAWNVQFERFTVLLTRLFFGAVIAFEIPLEALLDSRAFAWGTALGLVAGVVGKLQVGLVATHLPRGERAALGAAMVGRGELGFLIAGMAQRSGLFDPELFAIVTWALVIAVAASPLLFGLALRVMARMHPREDAAAMATSGTSIVLGPATPEVMLEGALACACALDAKIRQLSIVGGTESSLLRLQLASAGGASELNRALAELVGRERGAVASAPREQCTRVVSLFAATDTEEAATALQQRLAEGGSGSWEVVFVAQTETDGRAQVILQATLALSEALTPGTVSALQACAGVPVVLEAAAEAEEADHEKLHLVKQ